MGLIFTYAVIRILVQVHYCSSCTIEISLLLSYSIPLFCMSVRTAIKIEPFTHKFLSCGRSKGIPRGNGFYSACSLEIGVVMSE